LGSGFIVDRNCRVITNRHVVDTNGERVAGAIVRDPEAKARIAELRQQLQVSIFNAQQRRRALMNQPGTNVEQLQLDEQIRAMQAQLNDLPGYVSRVISDKVEGAGRKGFTAILVDGTEFKELHARVSDEADLASFTLPADNCPFIKAGSTAGLIVGERLFTVGNPSGLSYTVTSGVFSGIRVVDNLRYLQTDAPISPGNSGGPLIRENGEVVGINTLVIRGVPGVGLAIPIEAVARDL
jgi:S1-C subfamily serine protease